MKYTLNVSYNCGSSYIVLKESDNLEELKKEGRKLDEQTLRWGINDEKGKQVEYSAIHKNIINFMGAVSRRESVVTKHELIEGYEEVIRQVQEYLTYWVEARKKSKFLLLWALNYSPKSFLTAFEMVGDAEKNVQDNLKTLKKLRVHQLEVWRLKK